MEPRPAKPADVSHLIEIDGTVESTEYIHLERSGEGFSTGWKLEPRPLRSKLIESNALDDERQFALKQIVSGADEGIALVIEHAGAPMAMVLAKPEPSRETLGLIDVRVDYDIRRQGLATVLVYQVIAQAREQGLRAVSAETRTNNVPAARMLQKLGFEITGLDTHRHSNHDLVKEAATIFWYAALD